VSRLVSLSVLRLDSLSAGRSVGQSIGRLVSLSLIRLVSWSVGWLVGWSVYWLVSLSVSRMDGLPLLLRRLVAFMLNFTIANLKKLVCIAWLAVILSKRQELTVKLSNQKAFLNMGVWLGVAMDSLKFYPGLPYPTLLRRAGRPPLKRPYAVSGVALPPYAYDHKSLLKHPGPKNSTFKDLWFLGAFELDLEGIFIFIRFKLYS
jgi:hypothetical protein